MTIQSFCGKNGFRSGILGAVATLAFAAPISDADNGASANTYADRIGMYFDRTAAQERMGVVVMGTETVQFRQGLLSILTDASLTGGLLTAASSATQAGITLPHGTAPATPVNGNMWTTTAGLFVRISSVTVGPLAAAGGGGITGTLVSGRIPFANGVSSVTDNAAMTFSTGSGFNVNRSAVADNLMLGSNAGDTAMTGISNTMVGVSAGAGLTDGERNVVIGTGAMIVGTSCKNSVVIGVDALLTGVNAWNNVIIGDTAGAGITNTDENVVVGVEAMSVGSLQYNVAVGYRALQGGIGERDVAVGWKAMPLSAGYNVAIGSETGFLMDGAAFENVMIGNKATVHPTVEGSIVIGADAEAEYNYCIVMGNGSTATAARQLVLGGSFNTGYCDEVYIGYVPVTTSTINVNWQLGRNAITANLAGGNLGIKAASSTGNAIGGSVSFWTSPAGTAGTTQNALIQRLIISGDGGVSWAGIPTAQVPAVSAANRGTIFYDSSLQKFRYSENAGAYADAFGGGGGGTVTSVGISSTDLSVSGSPITTSGSITLNVNNGAISLVKMANLAANSIIGNNTGGAATPLALSTTQVTAMLNVFTTSLKGLAPASGGGTTNFLRADGTWAVPAGGGSSYPGTTVVTATAGGTTTLTGASSSVQFFTGTLNQTVVLPAATVNTIRFTIKNFSTGTVTVQRAGSDTIDGGTQVILAQYQSLDVIADGTSQWGIV